MMPLTIWSILEDSFTLILPTPSLLRSGKLNFPLIHSRCVSLFLPHRPHYHLLTAPTSPTRLPLPRPFTLLLFPPLHLCYHLFYSKHNLSLSPPGSARSQSPHFSSSTRSRLRPLHTPPLIPEPPVTPPPSSWLLIRRFKFYCNTICLSINCSFYWLRDNIDTWASKWSSHHWATWACYKRIKIQIFLESPAVFVHNATSADFLYHCDSSERK